MQPGTYSPFRVELLIAVLPLAAACAGSFASTLASGRFLIARASRFRVRRLSDRGTSELEFALAFPVFLMMILITIQMALMVNASLVVDYAAFCAARSAAVWIPYSTAQEPPYIIEDDRRSDKRQRIQRAAALACLPLAPRATELVSALFGPGAAEKPQFDLKYLAEIAGPQPNREISFLQLAKDLADKWPYAYFFTDVELLNPAGEAIRRFSARDPITAQVTHKFYMNVPFAGPLFGAIFGKQYAFIFGPYYVPITASYSLLMAQG